MENTLIQFLKDSTKNLVASYNNMSGMADLLISVASGEVVEITDVAKDFAYVNMDGVTTRLKTYDNLGHTILETYGTNLSSQYEKLLTQIDLTEANLDSYVKLADNTSVKLSNIIDDLTESSRLNELISTINDTISSSGSVTKTSIQTLIDGFNLNIQDKTDLLLSLDSLPDMVTGSNWKDVLIGYYQQWTVSKVSSSSDFMIELNTTRGTVKGFSVTLASITGVMNLTEILSAALLFIPGIVSKVIGIAGMVISKGFSFIQSVATEYKLNDTNFPVLRSPVGISTLSDEYFIQSNNYLPDNSAVRFTFSKYLPMLFCKCARGRTSVIGDAKYLYNLFVYPKYTLESICAYMRSMFTKMNVSSAYDVYVGTSSMIDLLKYTRRTTHLTEIDHCSGQFKLNSPAYIANTIYANVMLLGLFTLPVEKRVTENDDEWSYVYENFSRTAINTGLSNGYARMIAIFSRMGFQVMDTLYHDSESSVGLDDIQLVSDLVNLYQDFENNVPEAGYVYEFPGSILSVSTYIGGSTVSFKPTTITFGLWWDDHDRGNDLYIFDDYNFPQSGDFEFPNYSRDNLYKSLAFIGGVTVATVATIIGVKAALRKPLAQKRLERVRHLNELNDAYRANPTQANFDALYTATRSYNRKAKLFGWDTYDPANAWFNASTGLSGESNQVNLMYIAKLITG